MTQVSIRILDQRLRNEHAPLTYGTPGAAGADLRAAIEGPLVVEPGQVVLVPTGIAVHLRDPNLAAMILPRSGLGHKQGLVLGNLVGLIDSDYQGQLQISVWNRSVVPFTIQPMDRIAQFVVIPVVQPTWEVVDEFAATERGDGGFGSTEKG